MSIDSRLEKNSKHKFTIFPPIFEAGIKIFFLISQFGKKNIYLKPQAPQKTYSKDKLENL